MALTAELCDYGAEGTQQVNRSSVAFGAKPIK